jgi:catechol 2,3-dioxygenase-like lactoylglutathione lyase family enzyme
MDARGNTDSWETHARSGSSRIVPSQMAHVVLSALRYDDVVRWYKNVFEAREVFTSEMITFLAFDEEHHRIGVLNGSSRLKEKVEGTAGVDHIAFSYDSLEDLLTVYSRLKGLGIVPLLCINHGPTTSLYFKDPDGNKVELQVDNFGTKEGASEFFKSLEFLANPRGVEFDPDELLRKLKSGTPVAELLKRPEQRQQ